MSHCVPPEEFGRLLRAPAGAPERAHVDSCPRCRARLLAYQEFLDDRTIPAGADPVSAGAQLRAAFRQMTDAGRVSSEAAAAGASQAAPSSPAPGEDAVTASRLAARFRNLGARLGRPLVLWPAAVATLLVIGLFVGRGLYRTGPEADQLRGSDTPAGNVSTQITLLDARPEPEGIELRWRSIPGVTSYEVMIMGEDLADLARVPAAGDTTCVVPWLDLEPRPSSGDILGWQVVSLRDGAIVARSPIGEVRVP